MNIIKNIPRGFRLFRSVKIFNYYLDDIDQASKAGDPKKERDIIAYSTNLWANKVAEMFDIDVTVTGAEKIPMDEPCVFISNHQGYADIIVLFIALKGKQIGFIAKDTLENVPYFGKWIKTIHGVFMQRGDARAALRSIQAGVDTLKQGYSLVIFPEGTRSRCSKINAFKAGSFKLATKAKVPIVPVTIDGSYQVFEEKEYIKDGKVTVVIHDPIPTADLDRHQQTELHKHVEDIIAKTLEEIIEEKKGKE